MATNRKSKSGFANDLILAIVLIGSAFAAIEIPCFVHSRHCDGCSWFFCDHYNGR